MASPRDRRSAGVTSARTLIVSLVAALALASCATGQRPSFDADEPSQQATGDPAIDAVLERLDRVDIAQFTADYTINAVRFLDGTGTASTCNLTTAECEAVINDARVSDVQITHDFYGSSFARRLRVDAGRSLAPARGYTETIGGLPATCADVSVSGGTKVYCALDTGPLARYDGNDVMIELLAASPTPDESKFATS
jgi:hypothetical protein